MDINTIINGDCLEVLKSIPENSIDCCVTSPPYYALRDYGTGHWEGGDPQCPHYRTSKASDKTTTGHKRMQDSGSPVGDAIYKDVCPLCGAKRVDKQLGLEETPEKYIEKMTEVFMEVYRVLKPEGTLWLNIGDSYCGGGWRNSSLNEHSGEMQKAHKGTHCGETMPSCKGFNGVYKPKDLIGIPWMLAFSLRNAGWYLRQDIIWCLSGGTYVWVKSQKGVSPMMIKDLVRLNPSTIQLWNGEKWVNVLGYGESNDANEKIEIVLRSGERIGCTGGHKWVLKDGQEVLAKNLKVGDVLKTCTLPDSHKHTPSFMTKDLLWFLGLYLAEGSLADDTIQISLNADEKDWIDKIDGIAKHLGGTCSHTIEGNKLNVRVYSQVLFATLHQYIGGRTAKNKHLNNVCWSMPNDWLKEIVKGYFDGDGHYDKDNNRIRLGFTRNYDLERDLRVLASRLGAELTLTLSNSKIGDKSYPSFRGEWRWTRSEHHNSKGKSEIVAIRKSKARHFYDISVDSDDHLFSLASGVLTHNCKPNPMPESVKDRCTKSHEYVFLFSKSQKYYFDHEAIQEPAVTQGDVGNIKFGGNNDTHYATYSGKEWTPKTKNCQYDGQTPNTMHIKREMGMKDDAYTVRNKRDVWTYQVNTSSFDGFHPFSGFNYCQCFNYFQIYITHSEFQSCLFSGFLDHLPCTSH